MPADADVFGVVSSLIVHLSARVVAVQRTRLGTLVSVGAGVARGELRGKG